MTNLDPIGTKEEQKQYDEEERLEYQQVLLDAEETFLKTGAGRRTLWRILEITGFFDPHDACNATAYAFLAKRNIGLRILDMVGFSGVDGFFKIGDVGKLVTKDFEQLGRLNPLTNNKE